ncbi:hypothetical protein [Streptomyces scabiei]|uniref:hypothetical protein n=1 Tax=Streptomyces scabiei TaxID=1930 RepID=UPI0029B1F65E|nr:hypothetical protein [Streptomyces scabiei]MDX3205144.1 hypothetical protein [Streptomyces scabiei]
MLELPEDEKLLLIEDLKQLCLFNVYIQGVITRNMLGYVVKYRQMDQGETKEHKCRRGIMVKEIIDPREILNP